jgi:hypothetical protein
MMIYVLNHAMTLEQGPDATLAHPNPKMGRNNPKTGRDIKVISFVLKTNQHY